MKSKHLKVAKYHRNIFCTHMHCQQHSQDLCVYVAALLQIQVYIKHPKCEGAYHNISSLYTSPLPVLNKFMTYLLHTKCNHVASVLHPAKGCSHSSSSRNLESHVPLRNRTQNWTKHLARPSRDLEEKKFAYTLWSTSCAWRISSGVSPPLKRQFNVNNQSAMFINVRAK